MTNTGEIILIPNNIITDVAFTNYTKNDTIFLRINVSLSSNNNINYPELFEDLIITGSHSILVDTITEDQYNQTIKLLGKIPQAQVL